MSFISLQKPLSLAGFEHTSPQRAERSHDNPVREISTEMMQRTTRRRDTQSTAGFQLLRTLTSRPPRRTFSSSHHSVMDADLIKLVNKLQDTFANLGASFAGGPKPGAHARVRRRRAGHAPAGRRAYPHITLRPLFELLNRSAVSLRESPVSSRCT